MHQALLQVSGHVWWKEKDPSGLILRYGDGPNLIVDDGLEWIAGMLQTQDAIFYNIDSMQAGNGDATPAFDDEAIQGDLWADESTDHGTHISGDLGGDADGINVGAANTVLWRALFTAPGAVASIEEIGLFCATDDRMVARFLTGTIDNITAGNTITVAWAISIGTLGA